jgi:hypothetical protein
LNDPPSTLAAIAGSSGFSRIHLPTRILQCASASLVDFALLQGAFPNRTAGLAQHYSSDLRRTLALRLGRPLSWSFPPLQRIKRGQRPTPGLPDPAVQRLRPFSDP